ncbi:hypothetical protein MBN61_01015, partial [Candidatus Saccharibacteria bacterium]|nr:hypothetical protein [Candidatus Saccharibacteria bacterium]
MENDPDLASQTSPAPGDETDNTPETTEPSTNTSEPSFDLFAWANQLARLKNDLKVELFLINKHYTVYHLAVANTRQPQVAPVFIVDLLSEIEKGAG